MDASNAEHGLAMLVKWYYLASHVVDCTDENSAAFAKALRLTVQSFVLYRSRETRSRNPVVEWTGVHHVRPSPIDGRRVSDLGNPENRSEEESSGDDGDWKERVVDGGELPHLPDAGRGRKCLHSNGEL